MPRLSLLCVLAFTLVLPCYALDISPRLWNHLPLGANFAGVGYAYTEADFFVDPAILLEDVEMKLDTWIGKYIRTFSLFDKSTRIDLTQAHVEGKWEGLVDGVAAEASRSGWSDTFVRVAVNLYGAPPLRGKAFATYRSELKTETIVGVALAVRLPTGEYLEEKLINLGQNRFTFRPQLGIVHRRGNWAFEATGEIEFFTRNDDFYGGNTLEKKPNYTIYSHVNYTFRPGLWIGASVGYDKGGENSVNDIEKDDRRQNLGWAVRVAYPFNRQSGISVGYVRTRTQESVGFDSDTWAASLSLAW